MLANSAFAQETPSPVESATPPLEQSIPLEQQILDRLAQGLPAHDLLEAYKTTHPPSTSKDAVSPAVQTEAQQFKSALRSLRQALAAVQTQADGETLAALREAYRRFLATEAILENAFADTEKKLNEAGLAAVMMPRHDTARTKIRREVGALKAALAPLLAVQKQAANTTEETGQNAASSERPSVTLPQGLPEARRAVDALIGGEDKAVPLRAVTLPARVRNLAARAPVVAPSITPVYALSDETLAQAQVATDDTAPDVEAPFADEILALAETLKYDYAAIYEYVRNTIRTEWHAGSARGAVGTLRAGRGNDIDQASLLIALLRASGAPARYVHGVIELPVETVAATLNLADTTLVPEALARAGVAHRGIVRGGRVAVVEVEHTWVAARVPYTNYRGALVDATGPTWLPLDPSIKSWFNTAPTGVLSKILGRSESSSGSATLVDAYLQQAHDSDFLTELRERVKTYLQNQGGGGYEAQWGSHEIRPQTIGLLPNTLPYKVVAVTGEQATLDPAHQGTVRFRLYAAGNDTVPVMEATLPVSELSQQRLTLSYQPATLEDHRTTLLYGGMDLVPIYLIQLRPELRLNGKQVAIGNAPMASGTTARLEITLHNAAADETIEQHLQTAAYHAFAIGHGQPTRPATAAANDLESEAARQLDGLAVAYTRAWFEGEEELAALNATPVVRPYPGVAVTGTAFAVETVAGVPYTQKWRGVTLDAALRIAEPTGSQAARRDWVRLSALQGSSLEHRIFEQQFLVDAVSADKALGLMTPAGVVTLNAGNLDATLAVSGLSDAVGEDLRSALHLGYTVRIGAAALQRNIWNGNAWWIENPTNGAAGWFIAGKLAGGSTTEDPENWVLKFLADAFAGANSSAPNEDPLAGTSITRVTATDGQEGIVNQALAKPLQVRVRDKNGRPVKGASVTFLAGRGSGKFGGAGSVTVTTDAMGLASASYTLGKSTADWPVFVKRHEGDQYLTQAGYNTIDAQLHSATGTHYLEAPFVAKALPDTVTKLVRTNGSNVEGSANIASDTVILRATDAYDNPVSNVEITAIGGAPDNSCDPGPQTLLQPAKFANAESGASGCLPTPTSNECGQTPLTLKTRAGGTTAFFIFLGNSNATRYPVVFSGTNATLALDYRTHGACDEGPMLQTLFVESINDRGDVAAATYPVTLYGEKLEIRTFYTKPAYQIYQDGAGKYRMRYLPDRQLIPVPSAQVSFAYSNGGTATAAVPQGNGIWSTQMTTGPFPARDAGTTQISNAELTRDVVDPDTGAVSTQIVHTNSSGGAPSVWAVEAQIADVRSLEIEEGADPGRLYLNDDGGTRYPFEIQYRIEPPDYAGTYVDVLIYETSPADGKRAYFAQKGTHDGGTGSIRLERGFPFDGSSTYTVQVRVNPGSTYDEVLSEEVPLPFRQRLIRSYSSEARMQTDVDLINDRACRLGSQLDFFLNRASVVTLTADPLDDAVNDPQPIGSPTTLINSVTYAEGETHHYALDPAALLPRRNGYLFTLKAVDANDPSQVEEVQGLIRIGLSLSDALPVQQTLVKGVNIKSGRLVAAGLGFEYRGRGPQLAFRPMYSSAGETLGAMGYGWTHNFEASLQVTPCGDVLIQTGDGGAVRFLPDGGTSAGHSFKPAKGYHGTLIADEVEHAFDFYSKDGKRYRFKFVGGKTQWRLDKIIDPNGNTLEFTYGETGESGEALLQQVKDGSGRVLTYQYETRNFGGTVASALVGVAGPGGVHFALAYDGHGNLATIDKNGAAQESFAYGIDLPGLRHLMTAYTDANGHTTQYDYDTTDIDYTLPGAGSVHFNLPNGRVKTIATPDGGATSFAYATPAVRQPQTTRVTDPSGLTTYTTDTYGSPVKIDSPAGTTTMTWHSGDVLLASRTDPGNITTSYQYDAAGNVTREDVGGFTTQATWLIQSSAPYIKSLPTSRTDRNGHTTTYTYDNAGNLKSEARPEGVTLSLTYAANGDRLSTSDGNNHTTHYTWDTHGLPKTQSDPLHFETVYNYDIRGRLQKTALPNGATIFYLYDDLDRVTRITDAEGGNTTFAYDAAGNKTSEIDAEGRETRWTYDARNRVLTHTTPVGTKTYTYDFAGNKKTETNWRGEALAAFDYDGANRLTKRTETGGGGSSQSQYVTEYRYDAAGNLATEIDALSRETKHEYDALYRRTKTTDALGFEHKTVYDGNGNILEDTDAEGRVTKHTYDGLNRRTQTVAADGGASTWAYDKADNVLEETDGNGNKTVHTYDANDRRIQTADPLGQKTSYTYDNVGNLTKEINPRIQARDYGYDRLGRRIQSQDESKYVTTYGYDKVGNLKSETWPNGNKIEHDYDGLNRKIASRDSEGSLGGRQYDADGNLIQETDGNGNTTTHAYDSLNRRTSTTLPALPGAPTRKHQYTSYDAVGNLLKETDPVGNQRQHTYDALNRLTNTTDSLGPVSSYGYDKVGNLTSAKNGLGEETRYGYDALNRRIKQEDNLGVAWSGAYDQAGNLIEETDGNGHKTVTTYDANNRKRTTTRAHLLIETLEYDPTGNILFRTDARGTKEGWEYDPRNLATAHNRPLAMITKYSRDSMGDIVEERDPESRLTQSTWDKRRRLASRTVNGFETTTYAYDANGNPTQTTRPEGGSTVISYTAHNQPETIASAAGTARWTYDGNGIATGRTDARGHTTSYQNDLRGRRTQIAYPGNTGQTVYTYDLANRLKTTVENGITTSHTFDLRGRETKRAYSGGNITQTVRTWDGNGNRLTETVTDTSSGQPSSRTQTSQYDAFDRAERTTDAWGTVLLHTFDPNGNRLTTTAPGLVGTPAGNQVTRYTYDVNDRLTTLQSGSATLGWTYDRSGKVTKTTYPGGLTTEQTWDNASRLKSRIHKAASQEKQSFGYTYDKNGNRTQETRNLGTTAETITYTFDADDRLTGLTNSNGQSETYVLDGNGNRTQITRSGYPADNGVTLDTYDPRGRISERQSPSGTTTYGWDNAGRLIQTQTGSQTTTYTWNAEHQLTEIKQNGVPTANYRYTGGLRDQADQERTVWDGGFAFLKQDPSGNLLTRTEHVGSKALYLSGTAGNEILLRDGLDSVTGSIQGGNLLSSTNYGAWGESQQSGTTQSNHGYTGHLQDDTGLIYARARYYDPSIGRFISQDPLEGLLNSPITWNAYLYGNGNPFYYTDPTGEESVSTMIDKAAEGCGPWSCAGWAFLYGAYQVSTAGFASVHDPVRDAYDEGKISGSDYAVKGIGGGAAVAGLSLVTARVGGVALAGATTGGRIAGAAALGSISAQSGDALTQAAHVSAGVQESFDYDRNRNAALMGMAMGGGSATTAEGIVTIRQYLNRSTAHTNASLVQEGRRINTEAVPLERVQSAPANTSPQEARINQWVANHVNERETSKAASTIFEKPSVRVTSWADAGIQPDLNPGRWVQLGEATKLNFWRTGLPGPKGAFSKEFPFLKIEKSKVPFTNSITDEVPASSVQWPPGWDKWRGLFGQRKLTGGIE